MEQFCRLTKVKEESGMKNNGVEKTTFAFSCRGIKSDKVAAIYAVASFSPDQTVLCHSSSTLPASFKSTQLLNNEC